MIRNSEITKLSDSAGDYEQEVFECEKPKNAIIGVHGNGVRRWDGKKFYYQVAEHFSDSVVALVDQNQVEKNGCRLNSLEIMVERNQKIISNIRKNHPDLPIWVIAHSMGCGVASLLNTSDLAGIIFVAPGVGEQIPKYIERYGADIVNGKRTVSSDGYVKYISKEFMDSVIGLKWQNKYENLLNNFSPVHVFESGDDEIVDNERFELRVMPFTSYIIIEGAKHNFTGNYSEELFAKIRQIIDSNT